MLGLFTLREAADHLGVHPDTLKRWEEKGPRYTRTAGGHRRYDIVDLDEWKAGQARRHPALTR